MCRTNYEAVSDYFGHWAGLAFDRPSVKSSVKSSVAALLPKIPWCGPGAGLVRAWCGPGAPSPVRGWCVKRTTHASPPMWRLPRSEFFPEKKISLSPPTGEDVLAPKRGWCV